MRVFSLLILTTAIGFNISCARKKGSDSDSKESKTEIQESFIGALALPSDNDIQLLSWVKKGDEVTPNSKVLPREEDVREWEVQVSQHKLTLSCADDPCQVLDLRVAGSGVENNGQVIIEETVVTQKRITDIDGNQVNDLSSLDQKSQDQLQKFQSVDKVVRTSTKIEGLHDPISVYQGFNSEGQLVSQMINAVHLSKEDIKLYPDISAAFPSEGMDDFGVLRVHELISGLEDIQLTETDEFGRVAYSIVEDSEEPLESLTLYMDEPISQSFSEITFEMKPLSFENESTSEASTSLAGLDP